MKKKRDRQRAFTFVGWGGKRKGAGRKLATGKRPSVPHRSRVRLSARHPVHVTLRAFPKVVNLRTRGIFSTVKEIVHLATERFGFRIVQFTVQRNHLHLMIEAASWESLSRGAKGLRRRLRRDPIAARSEIHFAARQSSERGGIVTH